MYTSRRHPTAPAPHVTSSAADSLAAPPPPRLVTRPVTQSHRPRRDLLAPHELRLEPLAQAGEQRRPVARHDGQHDEFVLIDQSQIRQGQREGQAAREDAFARLLLELPNGVPQVPPYELRV